MFSELYLMPNTSLCLITPYYSSTDMPAIRQFRKCFSLFKNRILAGNAVSGLVIFSIIFFRFTEKDG